MCLLWWATFLVILSTTGHYPVLGATLPRERRLCPGGEFRNTATGQCQVCTDPCPRPLVQTSPCRHDKDTKCRRPSENIENQNSEVKACPFDSFFNLKTGLCETCRRYCVSPLVMTKPCKLTSNAVCRLPRTKHERKRERKERERGGKTKTGRKRKKENPTKARPLPVHHPSVATTAPPKRCPSDHFYDKEHGDCRPCLNCTTPGTEMHPCRIPTNNCQSIDDRQNSKALDSNEFPEAVVVEQSDRLRSNEYPGARNEPQSRVMDMKLLNIAE